MSTQPTSRHATRAGNGTNSVSHRRTRLFCAVVALYFVGAALFTLDPVLPSSATPHYWLAAGFVVLAGVFAMRALVLYVHDELN